MNRAALFFLRVFTLSLFADDKKPSEKFSDSLKGFVENFKGRGALNDGSKPSTPAEGIKKLKMAKLLKLPKT